MNRGIGLNKNVFTALVVTGTLAFTSIASAQDSDETLADKVLNGWSGKATLGAASSTGNAESSNINGSIRLGKRVERWEHLLFGSIFKGRSSLVIVDTDADDADDGRPQRRIVTGDNSDRIALGYQPKFYYTPKTYFFGILDWETDEPANIDSASRQVVGVGHRFYSNESGYLSAEVGLGNKNTDLVFGNSVNGGIGYLGLNFLSNVTEDVTFNADLRSDFGDENTFVELGLGVSFRLSDTLGFGISHFSRSNSDLSSGDNPLSSNSDSVTTLTLTVDI